MKIPAQTSLASSIARGGVKDATALYQSPLEDAGCSDISLKEVPVVHHKETALHSIPNPHVIPDSQSLNDSTNSASSLANLAVHQTQPSIGIENTWHSPNENSLQPKSSSIGVRNPKKSIPGLLDLVSSIETTQHLQSPQSIRDLTPIYLLSTEPLTSPPRSPNPASPCSPRRATMADSTPDFQHASARRQGSQLSFTQQSLQRYKARMLKSGLDPSSPLLFEEDDVTNEQHKADSPASIAPIAQEDKAQKAQESLPECSLETKSLRASPVIATLRGIERVRQSSSSPAVRGRNSRMNSPARNPSPSPPLRSQDVEWLIPVPLFDTPYDIYRKSFVYERNFLESFLSMSANDATKECLTKAQTLHQSLCNFTLHQDLIHEGPSSQPSLEPTKLAQWFTSISSKFRFLQQLFAALQTDPSKTVAVFVKPGQVCTYVEYVLDNLDSPVSCIGSTENVPQEVDNRTKVLLMNTNQSADLSIDISVDLILGLDETFDFSDPLVRKLRSREQGGFKPPALGLVVPLSLEHFARDVSDSANDVGALQRNLQRACQHRDKAGRFPTGMARIDAMASNLAAAIKNPETPLKLPTLAKFPLPSLDPSQNASAFEQQSSPIDPGPNHRSVQEASIALHQRLDQISAPVSVKKRPAQYSASLSNSHKRQRQMPSSYDDEPISSSTAEVTRITDSTHKVSGDVPSSHVPINRQDTTFPPSSPSHRPEHVSSMAQSLPSPTTLDMLKEQLRGAKRTENDLRAQIKAHERTITFLQPQHAELFQENLKLKSKCQLVAGLEETIRGLSDSNKALRANIKGANDEITHTRNLLNGSVQPDLRELADLQAKAAENESLKKKLEARSGELDYMRGLYQDASTSAANLGTGFESLRAELEDAKTRLQAAEAKEKSQLNEVFRHHHDSKIDEDLKQLHARLTSQGRLLETVSAQRDRLYEENEQLKERVGVGLHTRASSQRASSVPGVPATSTGASGTKAGERPRASHDLLRAAAANVAPASGGVGSRSGSRAGSKQGSRAASPGPNTRKGGAQAKGSNLR